MTIQPKTAALITAGVVVTAGIGYMIYFDNKRRNDPTLKRKLSKYKRDPGFSFYYVSLTNIIEKEKKKAQKQEQKVEEAVKSTALQIIESVMAAAEKEPLPTTAEAKEKYFMEQVGAGESLCNRGNIFLLDL